MYGMVVAWRRTIRYQYQYRGYSRCNTIQMKIVEALGSGERSRASSLLSEMGQRKGSLESRDFIPILRHCAESPDPLFVKETERMMREGGVELDEKCYSLINRALCKGGLIEEVFKEMSHLQDSSDFDPNLRMLNDLLGGCAQSQSDFASKCLDLMEDQFVGKNEITYTQLLKLAVSRQKLSSVHEIWKECTKYYNPNVLLLKNFVWSFSWLGDLEAAYDILQHMVSLTLQQGMALSRHGIVLQLDVPMPLICKLDLNGLPRGTKGNSGISSSKDGENLASGTSNNEHGSMTCPQRLDFEGAEIRRFNRCHNPSEVKILQLSFNSVIHACARKSNYKLAEELIKQMRELGLELSHISYDGFIKAAVADERHHIGLELLEEMRQKGLKPCDSTLVILAIGCSRALDLDLAESLLDQVSRSPSLRSYNIFLQSCHLLDQPERAVRALSKMKERKLLCDIRTYELLFLLFGSYNAPYEEGNLLSQVDVNKRIKAIEVDMVKNGIQHSTTSMNNLLKAFGAEGMVSKLIQYLRMAENQRSHGSSCVKTSTYNVVLNSLVAAEKSHMAIEIFKSMKLKGFFPNSTTYNIMIDCCHCFKSACALVSLMVREGFYPDVFAYTSLTKILLANGSMDQALKLLDQGTVEGIKPDVVLYNTFLREAWTQGRIDVIEFLVDQMLQNNIQPDPFTCSYVFSAYVAQGYINTAMEALQVLSMRMISQENGVLEEKKRELEENYIFAEDLKVESRILELFKDSKEFLSVALLNLRWCATLGFPISWVPDKSLWSNRLSSNFMDRQKKLVEAVKNDERQSRFSGRAISAQAHDPYIKGHNLFF